MYLHRVQRAQRLPPLSSVFGFVRMIKEHDFYHDICTLIFPFRGWKPWGMRFMVGSRYQVLARGSLQVHFALLDCDHLTN
jgi:hypothetical protein